MRLQQLLYNITRPQVMEEDSDLLSGGHNVTRYTGSIAEMKNPGVFFVLCFISVVTFLGNLLVIVAVLRDRALHTPTNFLILSLAGSDTLMGSVVMPFAALAEGMNGRWAFGQQWCEGWNSMDVLCSTASILNLCVISLERCIFIYIFQVLNALRLFFFSRVVLSYQIKPKLVLSTIFLGQKLQ